MTSDRPLSDEEINGFLDGELPPARRAEVQAQLALQPDLAAQVFAEAERMDALRSLQPSRLFPPRASFEAAKRLERGFRMRQGLSALRFLAASIALVALGWAANSIISAHRLGDQTVDDSFVLAAREALHVAQLDAGPRHGGEPKSEKIARLSSAINISMPSLPSDWEVTDVQLQPWNDKERLVVSANTPRLGEVTLVAAPMDGEVAVAPTSAKDGRMPTVYWQSGGTAYALIGPTAPDRLEKEAQGIAAFTQKNVDPRVRG